MAGKKGTDHLVAQERERELQFSQRMVRYKRGNNEFPLEEQGRANFLTIGDFLTITMLGKRTLPQSCFCTSYKAPPFCSRPSFRGHLCVRHPLKTELLCPSEAKGRFSTSQYNKGNVSLGAKGWCAYSPLKKR